MINNLVLKSAKGGQKPVVHYVMQKKSKQRSAPWEKPTEGAKNSYFLKSQQKRSRQLIKKSDSGTDTLQKEQ